MKFYYYSFCVECHIFALFCQMLLKKHKKLSEQKLLTCGAKNGGEIDSITPQHLE
jgi:hypothetical protein